MDKFDKMVDKIGYLINKEQAHIEMHTERKNSLIKLRESIKNRVVFDAVVSALEISSEIRND